MPAMIHLAYGALLSSLTSTICVSAIPQGNVDSAAGAISQAFADIVPTTAPAAPAASANTNVQVGNTPQSVGDLAGQDMIDKILAAVHPLCPDVNGGSGQCTGDNGEIEGIAHIAEDETLGGGTLIFNVRDSSYTSNDQRDGMIGLFASTMNSSASGTTNCAVKEYRSDCGLPKEKREALLQGGPETPNADCTTGKKTICSGPDNVAIEITENNSVVASLNIDTTFEWPGEAFSCSSVLALLEAALAFLPEVEYISKAADVAIGVAKPCCESEGCGKTGGD